MTFERIDAPPVTVAIATRNRRASLLRALDRLVACPERLPVVVVDNGSSDGTPRAVRERHPAVEVIEAGRNLGAAARTLAVRRARTPYVAFADDDSWWRPDALPLAARLLDAHRAVALVAARVLVGPEEREDPVSTAMATSPLGTDPSLPGPFVLGFVACGAVVRREAFLSVGGFSPGLGIGGEEELLAIDLACAGWRLVYAADVVAYHHPAERDPRRRREVQQRNLLWVSWLRRPGSRAAHLTARTALSATRDPAVRAGLREALGGARRVLRGRERIPPHVEEQLRLLEKENGRSAG